jgi:hypothetical protein
MGEAEGAAVDGCKKPEGYMHSGLCGCTHCWKELQKAPGSQQTLSALQLFQVGTHALDLTCVGSGTHWL